MTENTQTSAAEVSTHVAAAKTKPEIIHGRMPVAVVAMIRFGNQKGEATKALATLFGTTVGKIDDIKKGRNFAYVTADFKPTAEQKEIGINWLKSHPYYDASGVEKAVIELDATPVATAEEAAAYESTRVAAHGQLPTTKDGETAAAGGGNRRAKKAKPAAEGVAVDPTATADALLA